MLVGWTPTSQCHRPGGFTEGCPLVVLEAGDPKPRCPRGTSTQGIEARLFHALPGILAVYRHHWCPWAHGSANPVSAFTPSRGALPGCLCPNGSFLEGCQAHPNDLLLSSIASVKTLSPNPVLFRGLQPVNFEGTRFGLDVQSRQPHFKYCTVTCGL